MEYKLENISGIGPKRKEILNNNNIYNLYDLIYRFPKKYKYYNLKDNLNYLENNKKITVLIKIVTNPTEIYRNNLYITRFKGLFNKKEINIVAFNQRHIKYFVKRDKSFYITGKYNYYKNEISLVEIIKPKDFEIIKPEYGIENLSDNFIRNIIRETLSKNIRIDENLPTKIVEANKLLGKYETIKNLHNPQSINLFKQSIYRMKYEEAYKFQLNLKKYALNKQLRAPKKYDIEKVKKLIDKIPYELTNDQKRVVNEVYLDFKSNKTVYRLIQGDVGSGKTIVSAIIMYGAITSKEQVAFMAPTELLAIQHYKSLSKLFDNLINIKLLTSTTKDKQQIKNDLETGKIDLIVGTHALVEDDIVFNNLGLIVIDEQHKFGVKIRNKLIQKAKTKDIIYLTATPIPRTLASTLLLNIDISHIKEKPKNRKKIITEIISDENIERINEKIRKTINKKEHILIVAPAIKSEHAKYNVNNLYNYYSFKFKDKVYKIHSEEKDYENILKQFKNHNGAILISTSMIEVGIDIKDATLIVIFAAEYFGLSQIHQMRGRVGRSDKESYCYLVTKNPEDEKLKIIKNNDDGFEISKKDLMLRGPGEILGFEQSGEFKFTYLNFTKDIKIILKAQKDILNYMI